MAFPIFALIVLIIIIIVFAIFKDSLIILGKELLVDFVFACGFTIVLNLFYTLSETEIVISVIIITLVIFIVHVLTEPSGSSRGATMFPT